MKNSEQILFPLVDDYVSIANREAKPQKIQDIAMDNALKRYRFQKLIRT
jgi:hypothetical protein